MKKAMIIFVLFTLTALLGQFRIKAEINYQDLFENHNTIMLIINTNDNTIYEANQAAIDFYGFPREQLIGMSINDINMLTDEETQIEVDLATSEERNFFVFKHKIASGEIKTVHVYSYPVIIDDSVFLYSIIIDQSAFAAAELRNQILTFSIIIVLLILFGLAVYSFIKQKRQRVYENEEKRFRETLIQNLPGVVYRCLNDGDWTMLYLSDQIISLSGFTPSDFINSTITYLKLIKPQYRQYVADEFKLCLAENKVVELTYQIETKSHEVKWVQETARFINQKNEDNLDIIEGFIEDVTEKHNTKLKTDYLQYLLEYIVKNSNQGVAILDAKLNFVYVSDKFTEIYRINEKNIVGKHHYDVFPDLPEKWRKVHKRALKGEVLSGDRDIFERLDGTVDYTRWLCRPWVEINGNIGGIIIYTEVINDLISAELNYKESRDRLKLVMDNLPIGIAVNSITPTVEFEYMNDLFPAIYGTTKEKLQVSNSFWDEVYEDKAFRDEIKEKVLSGLASNDIEKMKWENIPLTKNGVISKYISASGTPIPGSDMIISMVRDVTNQKKRETEILYASNHDYLTSIPNRRYFEEKLKYCDDPKFLPLTLVMIDLDGLKLINDAYGHESGNSVLKKTSKILQEIKRDLDFVARIGGDEFVIIMPNTPEEECKKIENMIEDKTNILLFGEIKFSLSIGYETKKESNEDIADILNKAEDNMYANKVLHGQSTRNETIMSIFETLREKYVEERNHSDRVSNYCRLIGEKLSLSNDELKELELAGLMHDIGKITIPDNILDKPGKLNEDEWKIMKAHTINGYHILRSADKYSRLSEYALTHHERIDGKGYPNGLKGDEIPLFSRIICVADAYEAMTANRPYRKALSQEKAIEELKRHSGSQFDEKIVSIFLTEILDKTA